MKILAAISLLGGLVVAAAPGLGASTAQASTIPNPSFYTLSSPSKYPDLPAQYSPAAYSAPFEGIAQFYSRGLMQRVAANRGIHLMPIRFDHDALLLGKYLPHPNPAYVQGYAASSDRSDSSLLGKVVWASINGGAWERFQVIDVSQPRHVAAHRREHLLIEVDYESAVRRHITQRGQGPASVIYPRGLAPR